MSMRINTNLNALMAQQNLNTTSLAYSQSVQKLSSGLRINSAADDAAGLTISEKLRAQMTGLGQASSNAQDGISLLQTGEGALNETASILQRMRELTVQAGNDTLQASDRGAIKSEMDQLSSEITRIAGTTQFNGITLLNGSLSAKGTASAFNASGASGLGGLSTTALVTSATSVPSSPVTATLTAASALATIGTGGALTINGVSVNLTAGHTAGQTVQDINNTVGLGTAGAVTASLSTSGALVLTSNTPGAAGSITVGSATGAGNTVYANTGLTAGMNTVMGQDAPSVDASAGSYAINVTQQATAETITGTSAGITLGGSAPTLTGNTNVVSAHVGAAIATDDGTLTINGTNVVVGTGDDILKDINAASGATGVTASLSTGANPKLVLTSTTPGAATPAISMTTTEATGGTLAFDLGLTATATVAVGNNGVAVTNAGQTAAAGTSPVGSGTLTLNGVNILLTGGNTQAQVIAQINSSAAGVTATANGVGELQLTSTATGAASLISIGASGAVGNTLLHDLGLSTLASDATTADGSLTTAGVDAAGTYTAPGSSSAVAFTAVNGSTLTGGGVSVNTSTMALSSVGATYGTVTGATNATAGAGYDTLTTAIAATSTLTVNGVAVSLSGDTTLSSVVTAINAANTGSTASAVNGKLSFTNIGEGSTGKAPVITATGTVIADLGLGTGAATSDSGITVVAGTDKAGQAATTGNITGNSGMAAATAAAGTLTINGHNVAIASGSTIGQTIAAINAPANKTGVVASQNSSGGLVLTFATSGSSGGFNANTVTATAGSGNLMVNLGLGATAQLTANTVTTTAGTDEASTAATNNSFTFTNSNHALTLQIGANSGQTLNVGIEDMSATALGVANLDVSDSTAINAAGTGTLALIDKAIASVSAQRATMGAYENRLQHTISNLGVSQTNLTAAESQIRDVDMASEMVNFTKTGILQQAGQAILAQANQSGSGVMSLLR